MNLNTEQAKKIGFYIENEMSLLKTNREKASFFVKMLFKVFSINTLLESDCENAFGQLTQEGKTVSLNDISQKLSLILNKKNQEDWATICFQIKLLSPQNSKYHFSNSAIERGVAHLQEVMNKLSYN